MEACDMLLGDVMARMCGKYEDAMIRSIRDDMSIVLRNYDITKKPTELSTWCGQLPECYKMFFVAKKIEGKSQRTLELYDLYLKQFFMNVYKPIESIGPNDIRAHLLYMQEMRHNSGCTTANRRACLSSFFSWASAEGYIPKNPMMTVAKISYERKAREPLSNVDLEKVRMACKTPREMAIVEVLYATACRVSELVGLKRSDVDFVSGEVYLFGKGSKHRTSYLSTRAALYLTKYLNSRTDTSEYLFVTERGVAKGMTKEGVEAVIRGIGKRAEVTPLFPHRLRHTSATDALTNGMPVVQLKKLLGHESVDTTMIYAKVAANDVKNSHAKYIR